MRTKKEVLKAIANHEAKKLIKFCSQNKAFSKFKTLMKEYRNASQFCVSHKLYLSHIGWGMDSKNENDYWDNMRLFVQAISKQLS